MRPQSAKAKGRRLQQQVVADLYAAFPALRDGDLRSTSMGAGGEDVQMSAAARACIPYSFEAKNQERLNIWAAIEQSKSNCGERRSVVVIKKNGGCPYAVVEWAEFVRLIARGASAAPTPAPRCPDELCDAMVQLGEQLLQAAARARAAAAAAAAAAEEKEEEEEEEEGGGARPVEL